MNDIFNYITHYYGYQKETKISKSSIIYLNLNCTLHMFLLRNLPITIPGDELD